MKRFLGTAAPLALAAMGVVCAVVHGAEKTPDAADVGTAPATHQPVPVPNSLPDIGTKMPDGSVYAGLSMKTGKPSFVAPAGGKIPDGSVYAGISPDSDKPMYTTALDAPGVYTWSQAFAYCKTLSASGHDDWRVPTMAELAVQFGNRADIGGFNETGSAEYATGYYWSSLQVNDQEAWAQRFNDGFHEHPRKDINSLLRCVR
jgi:hypothetical protein